MRAWLVLGMLGGCEPEVAAPVEPRVLVGPIDGTDAELGLVVDGERVSAYVCGGELTRATISRWFEGAGSTDAGTLATDSWELAWNADTGTLTDPSGVVSTFAVADQTESAALYDADDSGCRDGAVVWDDGGGLVLLGTWGCYAAGTELLEVTPVGTLRIADTLEATATGSDGEHAFTLSRVAPP
jgi:hypothetical protein